MNFTVTLKFGSVSVLKKKLKKITEPKRIKKLVYVLRELPLNPSHPSFHPYLTHCTRFKNNPSSTSPRLLFHQNQLDPLQFPPPRPGCYFFFFLLLPVQVIVFYEEKQIAKWRNRPRLTLPLRNFARNQLIQVMFVPIQAPIVFVFVKFV